MNKPSEMTYLMRTHRDDAKARILAELAKVDGRVTRAALAFNVNGTTLLRWIHKLDLEDEVMRMRGIDPPAEELLAAPPAPLGGQPVTAESSAPPARGHHAGTARTRKPVPPEDHPVPTLDKRMQDLLLALAEEMGVSITAVIAIAIRELARKEGVLRKAEG